MKLADLRKLSIRKNLKIRFQLSNGLECVVTEHGLAQIPALARTPDFNVEQELAAVSRFLIEPAVVSKKAPAVPRAVDAQELTAMLGSSPATATEHEED